MPAPRVQHVRSAKAYLSYRVIGAAPIDILVA
jgi:hypothetical protein